MFRSHRHGRHRRHHRHHMGHGRVPYRGFDFRTFLRGIYGDRVVVKPYGTVPDEDDDTDVVEIPPPKKEDVMKVKKVDYLISENATHHHTDEYDIVQGEDGRPKQLVVRRGQPFDISVTFDRPFEKAKDDLKLVFQIGTTPSLTKGTAVMLILSDKDEPDKWGAKIVSQSGNTTKLKIFTPPMCIVGRWKLSIDALKTSNKDIEVISYKHGPPIFMLFNPWCKADSVYFPDKSGSGPDEVALREYILNESGKIYSGNYKQINAKPWNFGQFQDDILPCVLDLLEDGKIESCGNPVAVSRKLSALVNAQDDNGILVGNWSGKYSGGKKPTSWQGSVDIFEEFYKTKTPVKYGQCWVFSGLLTTALRTIGIPARSVTNFASAHDTDGTVTIDVHFDKTGKDLKHMNQDSVWNFHVWNECHFARTDLPKGYGGWQAVDATPQEQSDEVYRCGPVCVAAVKNGDVHYPYDGPFVFAEVNADKIYWMQDDLGNVKKLSVVKDKIGRKISTKSATTKRSSGLTWNRYKDDPEREDLTLDYKYEEGSPEERAAVKKAYLLSSNNDREEYERGEKDVEFELVTIDESLYGKPFDVVLKMTNKSKSPRNITGRLSVSSCFYTGVRHSLIKEVPGDMTVQTGKTMEVKMSVPFKEYDEKFVEQCMMTISVLCSVKETNQVFSDEDDFRLVKPDLTIKAPSEVHIGKKFKADISFANPLPIHLTECSLVVEGAGLLKPQTYRQPVVAEKGTFMATIEVAPTKVGERELMANFTSKELEGVSGVCSIRVKK